MKHEGLLNLRIGVRVSSGVQNNINAGLSQYIGDCSCPVQVGLANRKYTARDNVYE